MSPSSQIHAKISGPIVMIGFGSIGKGTLPLIERHFAYDKSRFVIIDPHEDGELAKKHGVRFIKQAVTQDNYREVLVPLLTAGGGQGFCVNLSVDTSSVDIMTLCREIGALYIDTVVEPWLGFYFDKNIGPEKRSNYALRETLLAAKHKSPGGTDRGLHLRRQSRHGVLVRQAGAARHRPRHQHAEFNEPKSREGWGQLAHKLGVKGIHIAERDTQRSKKPKPMNVFVNTWSVEGFVSEGMQPAELGWGTHEKWMPDNGRTHHRRLRCRDLSAAARRQHPRALMVPDAGRAIRLPRHAQRVDLDRRLFHGARRQQGDLSADLPLRLSSGQRCGAVAARDVRRDRQDAAEVAHSGRERDRGRHRRARRAALRPRQERLLVRLAALDRGNPPHRALPERHRHAGVVGGARRHGVGAGKSRTPASSRPTRWISTAASKSSGPISVR